MDLSGLIALAATVTVSMSLAALSCQTRSDRRSISRKGKTVKRGGALRDEDRMHPFDLDTSRGHDDESDTDQSFDIDPVRDAEHGDGGVGVWPDGQDLTESERDDFDEAYARDVLDIAPEDPGYDEDDALDFDKENISPDMTESHAP